MPDEKGVFFFNGSAYEVNRVLIYSVVQGLHSFRREWSIVNNLLFPFTSRPRVNHISGCKLFGFLALRELRIAGVFHGVQVVKPAPELIESVHGWQELISVTQVILTKLSCGIAQVSQETGKRGYPLGQTDRVTRQPHGVQARTHWKLPCNRS